MKQNVLSWLQHPKNVGQMRDADGTGKVKGKECNDFSKLFIKVSDGKISETKFQTYGGVVSIAATSAVSEIVKGKTLEEALAVTSKDVLEQIGSIEKSEMACVENAVALIASAINNFYKKQDRKDEKVEEVKEVESAAVVEAVAEEKPKAKRGRPAKKVSEETVEEKSQKKRGRPKKVVDEAVAETAAEKPKGKRGRPKKVVENQEVVAVTSVEQPVKEEQKDEQQNASEQKPEVESEQETTITVLARGEEPEEVDVDIFSEIDAITAKISEAVKKLNKK